jgi:NAD-dependent SIR2 family protein deacetylase
MWTPDDIERQFPALVQDLRGGQVSIFVGAGLSHLAGLPLWDQLMAPLADQLGLQQEKDPIAIAQYYVDAHAQGRYLLTRHVVEQLRNADPKFALAHHLIKELPLYAILTTNFDRLIEQTLDRLPERAHSLVIDDADLSYIANPRDLTVVKVNGCVSRPNSLILTREDFESYTDKRPALTNYLKHLLATSTFLFVGTSFRDPVFASFNSEVLQTLGPHRRAFYMIQLNVSKYEIESFKQRGIETINLDAAPNKGADDVTKFLESLVHLTRGAPPEEAPAAAPITDHQGRDPISRQDGVQLEPKYQTLLISRLGTGLSLQVNPDHIDTTHHYTHVFRKDLLDYASGDFVSIRRLKGINASDRLTSHIVYSESSERKLTFRQTAVRAFDCDSRTPLVVEPMRHEDEMAFTHAYRIFFPRSLSPGENFDVVHRITLPGELEVLSPNNEIMSISLARVQLGIDRLQFNVCLSFAPRSVIIECLDKHGTRVACKGSAPTVNPYRPEEWFEDEFRIDWSNPPHEIAWGCDEPDSSLYLINYRA